MCIGHIDIHIIYKHAFLIQNNAIEIICHENLINRYEDNAEHWHNLNYCDFQHRTNNPHAAFVL